MALPNFFKQFLLERLSETQVGIVEYFFGRFFYDFQFFGGLFCFRVIVSWPYEFEILRILAEESHIDTFRVLAQDFLSTIANSENRSPWRLKQAGFHQVLLCPAYTITKTTLFPA